jgi:hypothetical protein
MWSGYHNVSTSIAVDGVDIQAQIIDLKQEFCSLLILLRSERVEKTTIIKFGAYNIIINK